MIEDFWEDEIIYYIEFLTLDDRRVSKVIVLSSVYSLEEVFGIITEKFNDIKIIKNVDMWEECLHLKRNEIA